MLAQEPSQRLIAIRKRSPNAPFLGHHPEKDAPAEIFDRLAQDFEAYLKPDKFRASRIEMKLPISDPELDRLLSAATALGLKLPRHSRDLSSQVTIRDYIGFTVTEIAESEFVECQRFNPFIVCSSENAPHDLTRVASNQYIKQCKNRKIGAFVNLFHLLAVRGSAKDALETARLKGLELVPLVPDSGCWPDGIEPLHLVWSSNRLPALAGGLVHDGDFQVRPQLHYSGLETSKIDIAITGECFGDSPHYHRIIYSQRARAVLESIDTELQYQPVITGVEQAGGGQAATRSESV